MPPRPVDPAIRYAAKVDRRGPDECWLWTASRHRNGYGQFSDGRTQISAHRFGYQLAHGPVPPGLCVLHTCDNPPCQNPRHLFLGTQRDNALDREAKRRGNHHQGSRHRSARLTEQDVMLIRQRYQAGEHAQAIADAFGVGSAYLYAIVHGKKWSHVPMIPVARGRNGNPQLTDDDVRAIRAARANGVPLHLLSRQFRTTMSNISQIARRRSRSNVPDIP